MVIVIIDFKSSPSTYCLMQGRCFFCNNLRKKILTSKLGSQPIRSMSLNKTQTQEDGIRTYIHEGLVVNKKQLVINSIA